MEFTPKISVTWMDNSEIMRWRFEPYWDWLSFERAIRVSHQMMSIVDKPVVELMDFTESGQLPPDTLTEARKILSMKTPKNLQMVVSYGLDGYAQSAYRVLSYVVPLVHITGWNVKIADNFDDAYEIAYQHLYGESPSSHVG